jgi:hypothetical protein
LELEFLTSIERGEVVTQMALKKRIGVSIGLVNTPLGCAKARKAPFKRDAYCSTPRGLSEKSRLGAIYLENSLRGARREYAEVFAHARTEDRLMGSGDLAEFAILAAWGEGLMLVGPLDSETNRDQHCGIKAIRPLQDLGPFDAAVITGSRTPQKTYEAMRERLPEAQVLAPPLLKIARDDGDPATADKKTEQA